MLWPLTLPRVDALQLEEGFTNEEVSSEPIPAVRILAAALETLETLEAGWDHCAVSLSSLPLLTPPRFH